MSFSSSTPIGQLQFLRAFRVIVDGECNFELRQNNDAKLLFVGKEKKKCVSQMSEES